MLPIIAIGPCGVASTNSVFQPGDFFWAILCTDRLCALHLKLVLLLLYCTILLMTGICFCVLW